MEKQYDYKKYESLVREHWVTENIYHRQHHPGPLYSIDTPPPTVSGSLHLGHVFSYTQTDLVARYKRMQGFSVFYPFGFDDNGLPTERYVEKKHNVYAHGMKRSEFINLCLQETALVEKQFETLWQRIGLSVDWQACYSTISSSTRKISQESFIRLYKKGYIYRHYEPALYCTTCQTSVAQAELDDKEVSSHFNDLVFKTTDGQELIIGTTRPELLSSCVALFYNPADKRYQNLKNKNAIVPIFNNTVPIIADELVDIEKGTGLVMCCTFGDKTDIIWFKKHKLPFTQSIGLDGKWQSQAGQLAGLRAHAAREKMIELLKEQQLLKHQRPITHAVNVHERCKKEIEYMMLSQWFINILDHKQQFLDCANRINWYPTFMKSRYQNWVENLSWNWCLSRQRFFGIPFPAWHCNDCHEIILANIQQLPLDPQETPYQKQCPKCSGSNIVGDTDVMDTWNTSSLTPYIVQALFEPQRNSQFEPAPTFIPMSLRPQAHDIIRTWAFDTIVKVWFHDHKLPWHDIVISGHVLSGSQEKLSKSKEHSALSPEQLLETYPADAVRYWTACATLGQDVPFSDKQLQQGQRLITKLWNAFKFIHEHVAQHTITIHDEPKDLGAANEWLLQQMSSCFAHYRTSFDQYEFGQALTHVEKFFWNDFCDNYLELIKDQLFNPGNYSEQQLHATRWTLYTTGLRILQLYAPYIPYLTETLYTLIYQPHEKISSIHQTKFGSYQKVYAYPESANIMTLILAVISTVRTLKTKHQLSLKTDLSVLTISMADQQLLEQLRTQEQLLKGITRAQTIKYQATKYDESSLERVNDSWQAHVTVTTP